MPERGPQLVLPWPVSRPTRRVIHSTESWDSDAREQLSSPACAPHAQTNAADIFPGCLLRRRGCLFPPSLDRRSLLAGWLSQWIRTWLAVSRDFFREVFGILPVSPPAPPPRARQSPLWPALTIETYMNLSPFFFMLPDKRTIILTFESELRHTITP